MAEVVNGEVVYSDWLNGLRIEINGLLEQFKNSPDVGDVAAGIAAQTAALQFELAKIREVLELLVRQGAR